MSDDIHGRPGPIPPSPHRDEETLKLLRYFFREMCLEEKTPPVLAVQYTPEYLLQWIESHLFRYSKAEVLEQARTEEVGWDFLHEILNNAAGVLMINPLWPLITLSHRGDPKYPVKLLHFTLQITWADGRIFPMSVSLPAELIEGGVVNDAFLGCKLNDAYRHFMKHVVEVGLDGMHDTLSDDMGGEYPFQVVMGLLQQVIPQVKPEIAQYCHNYMRLCQALIDPSLPPQARQKLAALRAKRLQEQQKTSSSESVGGFDVE